MTVLILTVDLRDFFQAAARKFLDQQQVLTTCDISTAFFVFRASSVCVSCVFSNTILQYCVEHQFLVQLVFGGRVADTSINIVERQIAEQIFYGYVFSFSSFLRRNLKMLPL